MRCRKTTVVLLGQFWFFTAVSVQAAPTMEWVPVRVNALDGTYTINGSVGTNS